MATTSSHQPALLHLVCLHLINLHRRTAIATGRQQDATYLHRDYCDHLIFLTLESLRCRAESIRFCFQTRFNQAGQGSTPADFHTLRTVLQQVIEARWLLGTDPVKGRYCYQLTSEGEQHLRSALNNANRLSRMEYCASSDLRFSELADILESAAQPYLSWDIGRVRQEIYGVSTRLKNQAPVPYYQLA